MTDVADWTIVLAAGRAFVGRLTGNSVLRPAYELKADMMPTPQGQLASLLMITPIMGLASLEQVTVPAQGAVSIPVSSLSREERRRVEQGVGAAETMVRSMRAQEAGLVLAGPGQMPKVGAR